MRERQKALEELEDRMARLRRALRSALVQRDSVRAGELRAELRRVEGEWEERATAEPDTGPRPADARPVAALLPAREQVHQVLTLLGVAAAPKLISAVHGAFFSGDLPTSRLASLRRDEERSYRSTPNARPYYLCPALTADLLAPARALLTVSTWPLEQRIIGAYSPRVDFLAAAMKVSAAVVSHRELGESWAPGAMAQAERLLQSFAVSIPGAMPPVGGAGDAQALDPEQVARAAEAELAIHADTDRRERSAAAERARRQLDDVERLFGTRLTTVRGRATMDR